MIFNTDDRVRILLEQLPSEYDMAYSPYGFVQSVAADRCYICCDNGVCDWIPSQYLRHSAEGIHRYFNKLVRDKMPEIIEANGERCIWRALSGPDYLIALDHKLREELDEYLHSHNPEELADLLAVMMASAEAHGFDFLVVEELEELKAGRRGRFSRRIFLQETITPLNQK